MLPLCLLFLPAITSAASSFTLPSFSWDVVPRFVHCGPDHKPDQPGHPPRMSLDEVYERMAQFPMATLEKFTLQTEAPANINEEEKILKAAAAIRSHNTSTKVIFYHMAWQNFPQFDLYNLTQTHVKDAWTITWDNGTVPGYDDYSCAVGGKCGGGNYNLSNPDMRSAWVATMSKAMATGLVDGFFIDITPQVMPNHTETGDPVDPMIDSAVAMATMCKFCTPARRHALLDGLTTALNELQAACPKAIIICNPTDWAGCNTQFFEYFGSSADHGRSVLGDFNILQNKFKQTGHVVQARAATQNASWPFHLAEFLISVGPYTYLGLSHGWGCDSGWFDDFPDDPHVWQRPLGEPLGPMARTPNGALPLPPSKKHGGHGGTGGWVYTRSFAKGTKVWLNLTDGGLWKHARACTRPNKPWPDDPGCPQACIWWGDGAKTAWPPGFHCNQTQLL